MRRTRIRRWGMIRKCRRRRRRPAVSERSRVKVITPAAAKARRVPMAFPRIPMAGAPNQPKVSMGEATPLMRTMAMVTRRGRRVSPGVAQAGHADLAGAAEADGEAHDAEVLDAVLAGGAVEAEEINDGPGEEVEDCGGEESDEERRAADGAGHARGESGFMGRPWSERRWRSRRRRVRRSSGRRTIGGRSWCRRRRRRRRGWRHRDRCGRRPRCR